MWWDPATNALLGTPLFEWIKGGAALVAFLATAGASLYRYRKEKEKDRQARLDAVNAERRADAARFIIPFMRASENLQSRLWNILDNKGLGVLRDQYGDERTHADEILYQFAQYFGWQASVERYSEYGRDQSVIDLSEEIRHLLATDTLGSELRLFRPQQRDLGQMAVVRAGLDPSALTFDVTPFTDFRNQVDNVPGRKPVEAFLDTIRTAKSDNYEEKGRERLVKIQRSLVKLLEYLESKEKFRLMPEGKKRKNASIEPPLKRR